MASYMRVRDEKGNVITIPIIRGKDGQSAYALWLEQDGNEGKSKAEFLASLKSADALPYGGSVEYLRENGDIGQLYQIDGYVWGYTEASGWVKTGTQFLIVNSEDEMVNEGGTAYLLRKEDNGTVYTFIPASGDNNISEWDSLPEKSDDSNNVTEGQIVAYDGNKWEASLSQETIKHNAYETDTAVYDGFNNFGVGLDESNFVQIRNFAAKRWAYVDSVINFIACTSIDINPNTLTFTEAGQAELTAVLNDGCNETIVWTSDNEDVAVVGANGYGKATVTAIYNGSCNITASCGSFSATCTVSVSGFEEAVSKNIAGDDGKGGELTFGEYYANGMKTTGDRTFYTNMINYSEGDVFYIYGFEPRYIGGGYNTVACFNDAETQLKPGSQFRTSSEVDSTGPTRTVNNKTAMCYKVTLPNIADGTTKVILSGRLYFDGDVLYSTVTGGVIIIQRNEPITEETLQKYEALAAENA